MARGRGTFGLTSSRGRGGGSFRSGFRGGWRGRGRGRGGSSKPGEPAPKREDDGTQMAERFERIALNDEVDEKLGFSRIQEGGMKEGWLVNMHPVRILRCVRGFLLTCFVKTLLKDPDWPSGKAAVDYYFIQDDGGMFKATYAYEPYFCIACKVRSLLLAQTVSHRSTEWN